MGFAISIDWSEEWKHPEKWTNHGRNALEEGCKHKTQDTDPDGETNVRYSGYCEECGVGEDSAIPMMNFVYPLECDSFDDEKILKVVNETNCTVMENEDTGEWFLALCGGGMDLSQDIAYAYLIMEQWLPKDFLTKVCKQRGLSISKEKWDELAKAMVKQLRDRAGQFESEAKEWEERLKKK